MIHGPHELWIHGPAVSAKISVKPVNHMERLGRSQVFAAGESNRQLVYEVDRCMGIRASAVSRAWVVSHEDLIVGVWDRLPGLVEADLKWGVVVEESEDGPYAL